MQKAYTVLLIYETTDMKAAMQQLDTTAQKILYVVNDKEVLLGSLTDGDIRRAILKGATLETSVTQIMNKYPKVIKHNTSPNLIKKYIKDLEINSLPVVNDYNKVVDIVFAKNIMRQGKVTEFSISNNKVFILAGGVGSRLEPFTKILPKPLVPIGDTPILEMIMDRFTEYGFSNFILSVLYKADMIKTYFSEEEIKKKYNTIQYVKEDKPLGTIGSLQLAKDQLTETFFISNSDILVEEDMQKILNFHMSKKAMLTIVGCSKNSVIPYGVLKMDAQGFLTEIEEKPQYRHIINTGVYVAEPEIIDYIKPDCKMDITDLMEILMQKNKQIAVYPVFDDQWFDIGQWEEFERTRKKFEES